MDVYRGSMDIDPPFLNLGTRWRWEVSFTSPSLYPRGRTLVPMGGGRQSRSGRFGEVKYLFSTENRTKIPRWSKAQPVCYITTTFVVEVVPKDTFCLRRIYSLKPSSIKPWGIQSSREKPYLTDYSSSDVCISTKSHLRCSHSTSRLKTLKLWFLFVLPKRKKKIGQGTDKRNNQCRNLILARVPNSFGFHTTFVVSFGVVVYCALGARASRA
jgi:hypothetical protein